MPRIPITRANPYTPKSGAVAGQTFHSERQYRNALARRKGYSSWHAQQKTSKPIRGGKQFAAMRPAERLAQAKALEVLSLMRREALPLTRAARRVGTTPNTVHRYAGTALARDRGARTRARTSDDLLARMPVLTIEGPRELEVRGSRNRSLVGRHWNAVREYLLTGDTAQLRGFSGKSVSHFELEADPDAIDYWAPREPFTFEEIYDATR